MNASTLVDPPVPVARTLPEPSTSVICTPRLFRLLATTVDVLSLGQGERVIILGVLDRRVGVVHTPDREARGAWRGDAELVIAVLVEAEQIPVIVVRSPDVRRGTETSFWAWIEP